MEAALIALAGALVGHLLAAHFKSEERRAAQLKALAGFLDGIASCLEEMNKELSSYQVPTAAGNRLKAMIRDYEAVIHASEVDERVALALRGSVTKVRQLMVEGQAEDEILRGHILRLKEGQRADLLAGLVRAASKLRGEAETLRARAA